MMAIEILECDPTVWSDLSFFNAEDYQIQHSCDITTKLGSGETEWNSEDMKQFWDSFELDFNNEPDFAVEVMNTEVESQSDSAQTFDYLNTSAFLSPVSIAPSSPALQTDDNFELSSDLTYVNEHSLEEDLESTSALDLLDQLLSANSSDNEDSAEDSFDSAIDLVQEYAEVANESNISLNSAEIDCNSITTESNERNKSNIKKRRQLKRKTSSDSDAEYRPIKRSKRSKTSPIDKKERKKDQNKSAANRYRIKKRAEQESIDSLQEEQMKINEELKARFEKIQMEFKVVYPLAKAAFAADDKKNLLLQMIHIRVIKDNLLG